MGGQWGEWGSCDVCGGQRKRFRHINRMPTDGGQPCAYQASEEVGCCPSRCHGAVFCAWGRWDDSEKCSATCGGGTRKRVRYMQPHSQPLPTSLVKQFEATNSDGLVTGEAESRSQFDQR